MIILTIELMFGGELTDGSGGFPKLPEVIAFVTYILPMFGLGLYVLVTLDIVVPRSSEGNIRKTVNLIMVNLDGRLRRKETLVIESSDGKDSEEEAVEMPEGDSTAKPKEEEA